MTSARPPNAASGNPPPTTLPSVVRSGVMRMVSWAPPRARRKPVITSSHTNSAPARVHSSRSPSRNPGTGGTTPMFAATGSTITQAMSSPRASNSSPMACSELYGATRVSAAAAPVTPGESGSPNVATPEPARASNASACPW